MSRSIYAILSMNNSGFCENVNSYYTIELEIKDTTYMYI
jgi:hypothetical protein